MDKADELRPDEYEIKDLIANDRFIKSVNALRKRWKIPIMGFGSNWDQNKWNEQNQESMPDYIADVEALRIEFDLTFRWKTALLHFIPTANPLVLRAQSPWEIRYTYEGSTVASRKNVRDLMILTDESISQDEILDAQRTIKRLAKRPKKQLITNIDRDNKAYALHQSGESNMQIAAWLNKTHPGQAFNTDSVAKIIKRVSARRTKGHPTQD
ncbi:MAG: hypothetical protein AAB423_02185 [Patescibacteria group bacterium]